MSVTDEERSHWTVTDATQGMNEEIICECIAISKSEKMITPKGKSKPILTTSFVMKLVELDTDEEVTCYFPFTKSKAGHATVKHDGKFAMLYRLTFGDDPRKRYSQAQHLVNHFLGKQFLVTYEIATTQENDTYRKAVSIKPVAPIITDGWTKTGRLRQKSTARKKPKILGKVFDEPLKDVGKVFENSLTEKAENTHSYLDSPSISVTPTSLQANEQVHLKANDSDSIESISTNNNQPKEYTEFF